MKIVGHNDELNVSVSQSLSRMHLNCLSRAKPVSYTIRMSYMEAPTSI